MKVVRYNLSDDFRFDRSNREGGVVSKEGISGLFGAIGACISNNTSRKAFRLFCLLTSLLGGGLITLLSFIGAGSGVWQLAVGGYQALCAAVAYLYSELQ